MPKNQQQELPNICLTVDKNPLGKSGPKGNHFEYQGETYVGLRRDKKSGRFYAVGKGSPSFGSDPPSAIHKFRQRQQKQLGEPATTIDLPITSPAYDELGDQLPTVASLGSDGAHVNIQQVRSRSLLSQPDLD